MKKPVRFLFCLLLICSILPVSLFAQTEVQVNTLQDLDKEGQKLGALIIAQLKKESGNTKPKVLVGTFVYQNMIISLGNVMNQNLVNYLSVNGANQFQLISGAGTASPAPSSPGADYMITGEIVEIGNIFRIYTRLIRTKDNTIVYAWQTDLQKTMYLMDMVNVSGRSGIPMDIFEPDSFEHPIQVSLDGEKLSRTIHSRNDEDWFVYTALKDAYVFFVAEGTDDFDSCMELYNPGKRSLASNDDYGDSYDAGIVYQVKTGETIYIKVFGYDGETGFYSFSAGTIQIDDQNMEPNDTMGQAYPVEPKAEAYKGFFMSSNDVDWYKITVPPEDKMLLIYTDSDLDTYITLYDETGEVVAEDDDGGSGYNARLSFVVSGGTYYIELEELDGTTGPYSLYIKLNDAIIRDQYEPDNTMREAKEITVNNPQTRTFTNSDDMDWAWFTVTTAGTYTITAIGESSDLDTYLELYNEQGKLIGEDDDGGSSYDARLRIRLEPGKYYILAETLDDFSYPEMYTLSITR